ncbi:MAG: hypothetical protein J6B50_11565 [Lachnospiraceae bacterium]|nr:hypothetical protein [Lachnospiraceae bacterium]
MKKFGKTIGKKLMILAMSAILVGSTAGFVTPVMAAAPEGGAGGASGSEAITTGKDTDIILTGVNAPNATYGQGTTIGFTAKVKGEGYITSISPVVTDTFPFESNDAAYMVVEGNATATELKANYNFMVRSDVATGYQAVEFNIEYVKDGQTYSVIKTVNVKLEGAPAPTEAPAEEPTTEAPVSTPRVIVTGYETDVEKVLAGENFTLTLHLQNTSNKTAVSNMKVSMAAANGEFLPTSGSSTQFISSLGAGKTADITIEMSALASLEPKPYVLTVTCQYEDGKANPFESTENISIPVYQEARIKISEVTVSPDTIAVYNQGSVSFNINNLGKSTLANVQARLEGDTIECEETFVGNIAAGAAGYADVMVTGIEPTTDDGMVKLIITYEDSSGEECTYEEEVAVYVMEETFDDEFFGDEPIDEPKGMPVIAKLFIVLGVLAALAVIIVVVIIIVVKKKKRKAAEEAEALEDEIDDELLVDADKER